MASSQVEMEMNKDKARMMRMLCSSTETVCCSRVFSRFENGFFDNLGWFLFQKMMGGGKSGGGKTSKKGEEKEEGLIKWQFLSQKQY